MPLPATGESLYAVAKGSSNDSKTSTASSSGPVAINVVNGKPQGGIQKITVKKGQPVRFTVHSDVADEIHVHGYNFHKDVRKGGSVSFDFSATIDGIFVIELASRSDLRGCLDREHVGSARTRHRCRARGHCHYVHRCSPVGSTSLGSLGDPREVGARGGK